MTVQKFSQITLSPANLTSADYLVGVTAGNVDYRFSPAQIGAASDIVINTTPIIGGTDTCILFDKAGKVGEDTNLEWNYTSQAFTVNGSITCLFENVAAQTGAGVGPVVNLLGFNGGWQLGIDVANSPGSRDFFIGKGNGTFPNYNSSIGDFIYLAHNGASLPPTMGIAYTPPPTGYTVAISPWDVQTTWGNLLFRMGPSQTGDLITVKSSGGSTIWRMTALGSSNFTTMSGTIFQDLGTGVPIQLFNSGATQAYSFGFDSSGAGTHLLIRSVTGGFNIFDIDASGGALTLSLAASSVLSYSAGVWSSGGFTGTNQFQAAYCVAISTTTNVPGFYNKLNTDGNYRLVMGLDSADNPNLGLGPGNNVLDIFVNRQAAGVLGIGTSTTNAGGTVKGGAFVATADPGGTASTNTLSNGASTTISTGVGVIHMSTANPATNSGWLKCYVGTQVAWIPCWTTNAP